MAAVGGADGDALDLGIAQDLVIVGGDDAAAVLVAQLFGPLGNQVAEVLDFRQVGRRLIGRQMRGTSDVTAADDGNLDLAHLFTFLLFFW